LYGTECAWTPESIDAAGAELPGSCLFSVAVTTVVATTDQETSGDGAIGISIGIGGGTGTGTIIDGATNIVTGVGTGIETGTTTEAPIGITGTSGGADKGQIECGARILNINTTESSKSPSDAISVLSEFQAMLEQVSSTDTGKMPDEKLAEYSDGTADGFNCTSVVQVKAVVEQLLALTRQYITDDASVSYVCAFEFELEHSQFFKVVC
jgi:hypothetical protein